MYADGITHANCLYTFGTADIYNNYFHDLTTNGPMAVYCSPGWSSSPGVVHIYNNVLSNVISNTPISIDQEGTTVSASSAYIFNNTATCRSALYFRVVDRSQTLGTLYLVL